MSAPLQGETEMSFTTAEPEKDEFEKELEARKLQHEQRKRELRARARKLGMTLKSYSYSSFRLSRAGERSDVVWVNCDGLDALEGWIRRFETVLGDLSVKPTNQALIEADRAARELFSAEQDAKFLASKCNWCGEPPDAPPHDLAWWGSEGYEFWLHKRCEEPASAAWDRAEQQAGVTSE